MNKLPVAKLNDGQMMPLVGLGTSRLEDAYAAVKSALEIGYRHIDTAAMYGNEAEVGRAVRDSGVPREQIFITTKLPNDAHERVEQALQGSLERLGLDYIDLYLIHWPMPKRVAAWQALEKLKSAGAPIRSIGVSNFTIRHLKELLEASKHVPAVNQVEFHPFVYQPDLVDFNQAKGIQLVAYSPMTRGHKLKHPALNEVAKATGKSVNQVLLRWCIQHRVIVIPKSSTSEHQRANQEIFDWKLSQEQMKLLDNLYDGFRVTEDPETYV